MQHLVLWHRIVPAAREELDDPAELVGWSRSVAARLAAIHGTHILGVGGTVAAVFDLTDVAAALDAAIALLNEADEADVPIKITFGAAAGDVTRVAGQPPLLTGGAIDRAQLLANRARSGELLLDPAALSLASGRFLFAREAASGVSSLRGHAIDRRYPHRDVCRPSIRHLGEPPIPSGAAAALARLREVAADGGQHRLILRGGPEAGAREWIRALAEELRPPLVLWLDGVPDALEPLGSLRLALQRRFNGAEGIAEVLRQRGGSKPAALTLASIVEGRAVDRAAVLLALRELLSAFSDAGGRPWLVLDPLSAVDPASVDAAVAAAADDVGGCLLLGRLSPDKHVPNPVLDEVGHEELDLPSLTPDDAREVAQAILGKRTERDVTRRVATFGGDNPLGIVETARTLVASGDLVYHHDAFRWRVGPRVAARAIPVESLINERIAALEPTPLRVLEAVCVAPPGTPRELIQEIAHADGVSSRALVEAVEQLRVEALLTREDPWETTSPALRNVVVESMPPARSGELCRFVAAAMKTALGPSAEFAKATMGYFMAEGGNEAEGARALIEAGRAASLSGFARAAVRLAANAVQLDGSAETRAAATGISRSARGSDGHRSTVPPPQDTVVASLDEVAEEQPEDLVESAVRSIMRRDLETADRLIDVAIAEGRDRASAYRMRAIAHLCRGEREAAMELLAASQTHGSSDPKARARYLIARTLVLLAGGNVTAALRSALGALADTREARDEHGEVAALRTLAACYDAAGQPDAAGALEAMSPQH